MRKEFKEIYLLRVVSCLAIVFLHSISSAFANSNLKGQAIEPILQSIKLLLMFGTPTFVLISEFLLSASYNDKLPSNFFHKRIRFILIPYLSMGFFYAWFELWKNSKLITPETFSIEAAKNIFLGEYHGYFVLIIFQFYILHALFQKYIYKKYQKFKVILISFFITLAYLSFFNFSNVPFERYAKIPFIGWFFYFVVGFYAGKKYDKINVWVAKYYNYLLILFVFLSAILLIDYHIIGFHSSNSKRFDLILYTVVVASLLFYRASKFSKMPSFVIFINGFTFGIYLLHPFFLKTFERFIPAYISFDHPILYIFTVFTFSVVCSISIIYLFNRFEFGAYIVGQINNRPHANLLKTNRSTDKEPVSISIIDSSS